MKTIEITYTTDNPSKAYATAIRAAKTRAGLIRTIQPYERVADDALKAAKGLSENDFVDFTKDITKAGTRQSIAWVERFNERFGVIAIPAKLMLATLIAEKYRVPWGAAVIRCEEEKWPMLNIQKQPNP